MKVQICSDLHLEFTANKNWLKENPILPSGDILIIAGDTNYLGRDFTTLDFINKVSNEFEAVYLIPGNHEYYDGSDISKTLDDFEVKIKDNVFMLNNKAVNIKGVKFIFSTLWSKIDKNIIDITMGMADFKYIKYDRQTFDVKKFNEIHEKCFKFIEQEVKGDGKKVVVSHHLPSNECNIEEFKNSILNPAFCVEKTDFISDSEIDFWVYGHSHRNIPDFEINGTKLITNQLGYVGKQENYSFERNKIFEI